MFEKLDEKITSLKDHWEEASIEYHFYGNENNSTLVSQLFVLLTTVTLFVNIVLLCMFEIRFHKLGSWNQQSQYAKSKTVIRPDKVIRFYCNYLKNVNFGGH